MWLTRWGDIDLYPWEVCASVHHVCLRPCVLYSTIYYQHWAREYQDQISGHETSALIFDSNPISPWWSLSHSCQDGGSFACLLVSWLEDHSNWVAYMCSWEFNGDPYSVPWWKHSPYINQHFNSWNLEFWEWEIKILQVRYWSDGQQGQSWFYL